MPEVFTPTLTHKLTPNSSHPGDSNPRPADYESAALTN